MIELHIRSKASLKPLCSVIFEYFVSDLCRPTLFSTKDYKMPKRLKAVAVDPAKSNILDYEHPTSANVVQFVRSSFCEGRPSQRLRPSDSGDPGPAGFDWQELKPF
jgi:hypothetical protein